MSENADELKHRHKQERRNKTRTKTKVETAPNGPAPREEKRIDPMQNWPGQGNLLCITKPGGNDDLDNP